MIVSEVLEHLEHDAEALEEVSRVLRPGGLLAVSVPREGPETICWALSSDYPAPRSPGGHVRIYQGDSLRRMIEPDPGEPRVIRSIRGVGYQLDSAAVRDADS